MKSRGIIYWLKRVVITVVLMYVGFCSYLYLVQESIVFRPKKLQQDYKFQFDQKFEELVIKTQDNTDLSGLLFKADSAKGLVFYLHGNTGAIDSWGEIAKIYTKMHYNFFVLDYRGYGKSGGEISSEEQLYSDVQTAYNRIKGMYNEKDIMIFGYSIGTGPAAMLAANNNPKGLVLNAPYFKLTDIMFQKIPFVPTFLLKYEFPTANFIRETKVPITIFHGDRDDVIYYGSSLKLKQFLKRGDKLITLQGAGHVGMNYNREYQKQLKHILE